MAFKIIPKEDVKLQWSRLMNTICEIDLQDYEAHG